MQTVKGPFLQPLYPSSLSKLPLLSSGAPWGLAARQPPGCCLGQGQHPAVFPSPSKHLACSGAGMPQCSEQSWPGLSTGKRRWLGLQVAFWVRSCARPSKNRSSVLIHLLFLHGFHKALVISTYHVHLSSPSKASRCQIDSPQRQDGPSLLQMLLWQLPRARLGPQVGPCTSPKPARAAWLDAV